MSLGNVVVTGAAGRIGTVVRSGLREEVSRLVLIDRHELTSSARIEEVHRLDLRDLDAVVAACKGADSIVHLSGIPDEASFPDLLDSNVLMTYHVLEAARRQNVQRVVLASSNRVTGFYSVAQTVTPDMPPRPDGFYGVSKAAVEALGRMYADKFGLSVVCLRIGSFENEPSEQRHLATWLSPREVWVSFAPLWLPRMCTSRRCTRCPPTPGDTGTRVRRRWDTHLWTTPRHTPPR